MCISLLISARLIPVLEITSKGLIDASLRNHEQRFGILSFCMQFRGLQKHGTSKDLIDTSLRNHEQGFGVLSFFMQFRGLQKLINIQNVVKN